MPDNNYRQDTHNGGRKSFCYNCGQKGCVFYTKRGDLTPYAFRCGYIERRGSVTLERQSGGSYCVSGIDTTGARVNNSFLRLRDARRYFRAYHGRNPGKGQLELFSG